MKEQQEILEKETKDDDDEQVKGLKQVLVSLIDSKDTKFHKSSKPVESSEDIAQVAALKLQSILKRSKPSK